MQVLPLYKFQEEVSHSIENRMGQMTVAIDGIDSWFYSCDQQTWTLTCHFDKEAPDLSWLPAFGVIVTKVQTATTLFVSGKFR